MLRRSFRFGLLFGLAAGLVAAVVKAVQSRTGGTGEPAPAPWTPLPDAEPVVVPPKPAPTAAPAAPSAPATPRPKVEIGALQEPPVEPSRKRTAPIKKPAPKPKTLPPWVEPVDGEAPPTHPVKAKLSSGIYHVPGGLNYARTRPDRCYVDAAAAEADGLRPSKR